MKLKDYFESRNIILLLKEEIKKLEGKKKIRWFMILLLEVLER